MSIMALPLASVCVGRPATLVPHGLVDGLGMEM